MPPAPSKQTPYCSEFRIQHKEPLRNLWSGNSVCESKEVKCRGWKCCLGLLLIRAGWELLPGAFRRIDPLENHQGELCTSPFLHSCLQPTGCLTNSFSLVCPALWADRVARAHFIRPVAEAGGDSEWPHRQGLCTFIHSRAKDQGIFNQDVWWNYKTIIRKGNNK